ncbi:DUF6332 family protein [Streptomyces sp. NPDC086783]|uniref:DUF6332 family protein n=1 Tax=Streptomyces sp. NPDC086783 TaxID=3365758 RepID=UPI00380B6AEE
MGKRTQAERDAMTVEIGYALFAGAVLAGAAFMAVAHALPAAFGISGGPLRQTAAGLAAGVFFATVVTVLTRFPRIGQPSQPGRTNPDS